MNAIGAFAEAGSAPRSRPVATIATTANDCAIANDDGLAQAPTGGIEARPEWWSACRSSVTRGLPVPKLLRVRIERFSGNGREHEPE
jgi:hypothetical protein